MFNLYYGVKNLHTFLTIFMSSIYAQSTHSSAMTGSESEVCQEIDGTRLTQLSETAFSVENW